MSGVTFPKTWADGETLTHTDLNATTAAINTAVGVASGLASLNSSTLVVEDPANATATKAAGKICKWGASEAFQCSALTATTIAGTTITGSGVVQGTQLTSTIADGTAPLVVTSTTEVANLKAATATLATTATSATSATTATTANRVTDGTNNIRIKVIDIGDWNMDATASVTVAHGLTLANIRSVSGVIRNDSGSTSYCITPQANATEAVYMSSIGATVVSLGRAGAGIFDHTDFDATSYNRGWIAITYVE